MKLIAFILCLIGGLQFLTIRCDANRTFLVDWQHDRFLKDGRPFRFIAGSFHYFRAHPDTWQRKLRTMRAAGLNAVTTYVEWSLHNPKPGVYVWDGIADLVRFIKYAIDEDLLVILRPGPYICAERDFGGFPYWLLTKYPTIQLRTADINYLYEIRIWYSQLMAKVKPYLYGNGGPIIMVQVENEYGSYFACDKKYRTWLRDETLGHVGNKAVLFTNDGPGMVACGHIDGVLGTLDFGATNTLDEFWGRLRRVQPRGPLVNAEYYPGWLTHWSEKMQRYDSDSITQTFIDMLEDGASVNFYMFFGGTNFGFTAGANDGGPGQFEPDITSYDYDAPMTEAGDPTPKYHVLREIIGRYLPLPNIPVPEPVPKRAYGTIRLNACCSILSPEGRRKLATGVIVSDKPKTFEALDQYSGLVLYETDLPGFQQDPTILSAPDLHDRGYIYVDNELAGILARQVPIYELPIMRGNRLQMLVESQGRINFGPTTDFKGLTGNVLFGKKILTNWTMTKFPLESYADIERFIEYSVNDELPGFHTQPLTKLMRNGPMIYYGVLNINDQNGLKDTYLDSTGWGKGLLFVNGENLGRYWPMVGPQITLYVPKEVLKRGANRIVMIEYQSAPSIPEVQFTDKANFQDGQ